MAVHARSPHILLTVLTYVALGPVIAGIVWALQPLGKFDAEMLVVLPSAWWRIGVAAGPGGWLFTLIPTILAAALYWIVCNAILRLLPSLGSGRFLLVIASAAAGALTAVASWVLLFSMLGGRWVSIPDVASWLTAFGVVATGASLGTFLGFFCRRGPNSPHGLNGARREG
jgi:hypothetical protein